METASPGALSDATVSSLMNMNQFGWDEDLVHDIFSQRDCSTPNYTLVVY